MPGAQGASGLRLWLPTPSRWPVNSVPLSSLTAEPVGQPSPLLVLSLGLPFSVGCPPRLQGLSPAQCLVTSHHEAGIAVLSSDGRKTGAFSFFQR